VGGSSYGGTISFILLWEHSQIFSKAACFSPGFITSEMNYVDKVNESDIHDDVELYLDNGGIGLEGEIQIGIDSMLTVLQNKGFKAGEDYYFILDEKAEHNESAWAKRVPSMMKILFGK
jgi:predicted alpha/beta superfamily hydrolase